MSTVKLEIKGNFLKITDNINDNDEVLISGITKYFFSKNDTILNIRTEQGANQVTYKYKVSVLVDDTDTPFADTEALEVFLSDNLGSGANSGTGSDSILTVIQCPRRISLSSIDTWYSHYQNSNTSWLDGLWSRTSGTGATPSRVQANFQNTGAYYIENKTQMDSLDFYVRTANVAGNYDVIVYSYDFSTNDGNETNEQILVQETFNIPSSGTSYAHSFTINAHSFSNPTIIQVFIRNTTGTGNLDNPFFTYKFS